MAQHGIEQEDCCRPGEPVGLDRRVRKVAERLAAAPHLKPRALAGEQNLSVSWLGQLFKTHTGEALRAFIIRRRMLQAARLLRTTELRIKEIAARVGYAHTPSFVRIFSRVHGASPQGFRRAAEPHALPLSCLHLTAFRPPSPLLCPLCRMCVTPAPGPRPAAQYRAES